MSFKDDPWLLHLEPPPTGVFARASILVPITRYASMAKLHLLTPLWPVGNAKRRIEVINAFHKAMRTDRDQVAEMARLMHLADETRASHPHLVAATAVCSQGTAPVAPAQAARPAKRVRLATK
jgi:hypothetical protein